MPQVTHSPGCGEKLSFVDEAYNWEPLNVPELPERVLIDFATKCNLRCPMCTVWGSGDDNAIGALKGVMPDAGIDKVISEISPNKPLVQPNLWGEPLLIPNLKEKFNKMKDEGIAIALNTNGLALTDDLAKYFVEIEVDSVTFSLDAVSRESLSKIRGIENIEKTEAAVFRMLLARGDHRLPRIGVSFTLQEANAHEENVFINRWSTLVDYVRVGLVFEDGTFKAMKTQSDRKPCPAIYKTLPIHNDGAVTICCLEGFKTTTVGNVFDQSVASVWHGEAFTKIRYYHETGQWDKVPFCENCNGWAQDDYVQEIRDGLLIRRSPEYTYYNRIDRLDNWQGNLLGGHTISLTNTEQDS